MKTQISILGMLIIHLHAFNQTTYDFLKVYDARYGITLFDKLNFRTGGDSIRKCNGYACRGWMKDYYDDGAIMHQGFYVDGQLKNFKNFFPNGGVEREFKILDDFRSTLSVFYPTGQLKSEIKYSKSSPILWQDYYMNGNPEFYEEYDRNIEYHIAQRFYYENGSPKTTLEIENKKKLQYIRKEYFENGTIKAQGFMIYNTSQLDYQKKGLWTEFDESGKQINQQEF